MAVVLAIQQNKGNDLKVLGKRSLGCDVKKWIIIICEPSLGTTPIYYSIRTKIAT